MPDRIGPKVSLSLSCFDCIHCHTKSYTCQGDSGSTVSCGAEGDRHIGDTSWNTPNWCPFKNEAILRAITVLREDSHAG